MDTTTVHHLMLKLRSLKLLKSLKLYHSVTLVKISEMISQPSKLINRSILTAYCGREFTQEIRVQITKLDLGSWSNSAYLHKEKKNKRYDLLIFSYNKESPPLYCFLIPFFLLSEFGCFPMIKNVNFLPCRGSEHNKLASQFQMSGITRYVTARTAKRSLRFKTDILFFFGWNYKKKGFRLVIVKEAERKFPTFWTSLPHIMK